MWTVLGIQAEIPRQSKDRVGSRGGGAPEKEKETMMCVSDCVASPLNAHVEVLISNVTGFRNGNFRWIIKLKMRWDPNQVEEDVLQLAFAPSMRMCVQWEGPCGPNKAAVYERPSQKITPQFLLLLLLDSTSVPQNTNCLRYSVLFCRGGQAKGKSQNPEWADLSWLRGTGTGRWHHKVTWAQGEGHFPWHTPCEWQGSQQACLCVGRHKTNESEILESSMFQTNKLSWNKMNNTEKGKIWKGLWFLAQHFEQKSKNVGTKFCLKRNTCGTNFTNLGTLGRIVTLSKRHESSIRTRNKWCSLHSPLSFRALLHWFHTTQRIPRTEIIQYNGRLFLWGPYHDNIAMDLGVWALL